MKRLLAVLFLTGCAAAFQQPASQPQAMLPAAASHAFQGATTPKFQHVIILFQENRSFDNLFEGFPGADTVTSGLNHKGKPVPLHQVDLITNYDLDHSHYGFTEDYDGGKMDGFDLEQIRSSAGPSPPADAPYAYVNQSEVQPYWTMAQEYALSDRMFETQEGASYPAHLYIIAGTSETDDTGVNSVMGDPNNPDLDRVGGCDSPKGVTVPLINPSTNARPTPMYPCFEHPVFMDLLDHAGLSWKYYQTHAGAGLWNAPDSIEHIRNGPDYKNVVYPSKQILSDISANQLPDVAWVMPSAIESDHPNVVGGNEGPAWIAEVVNAVGKSAYWKNTVIFVTWDDWGGWYDHVAPQQFNYYELGFRVPLIAISQYTRPHYVSHVQHEFGSLLKFMEQNYGLPSMNTTDKRADNLGDMFNYTQTPIPFTPIPAPTVPAAAQRDTGPIDDDF